MNYFKINAKLPSLNDYIDVCRSNKYKAAKMKKDVEEIIGYSIKSAQVKGLLTPTDKPIIVHFAWFEKTKRRDADNIVFAKKFILDAMQKFDIIPNDNRQYVKGFHDDVIDSDHDGVLVSIYESLK